MAATRPRILVALAALMLSIVGAPAHAAAATPAELAQALQRKVDAIKDFSADFVHSYEGGVLHKRLTERGHLLVKKPGKMRWEYSAPDEKLFVSDGVKLYSYIPQDKQVIVSSVPPGDQATTPALFLAGKGDIVRDFSASYVNSTIPGTLALKLMPRQSEPDYEYLVIAVDPATLQMRALTTRDREGGESTLVFNNLKENRGIPDKEFAFRIPRGVDVITDGTHN